MNSDEILSSRKFDVLNLIQEGFTNQEIGNKLFISMHTVKTHSKNINIKYQEKMEQVFELNKGKVINSFAFGFHLTEQSNDEQIKEALKLQPNLIVHFESYPKDWRVVVGLDEPLENLSLKELKMLAPDFGGKSKNPEITT